MAWLWLLIAGLFEIGWAAGIKHCDGLKLNIALIIVVSSMTLSMFFLSLALKSIPMGIAYSVWTGIGIIGVFLYQVLIFKETISFSNLIFILLILIGIIGLKINSK
jgi:quaternary ammonium compound-resistance protein SugE